MSNVSYLINAVDHTALIQATPAAQWSTLLENRGAASFDLFDPTQAFTPAVGQPVAIYDTDGVQVWAGDIADITVSGKFEHSTAKLYYKCSCTGIVARLDKRMVEGKAYLGTTPGFMVSDLLTNWAAGEGITAGNIQPGTQPVSFFGNSTSSQLFSFAPWPASIRQDQMVMLGTVLSTMPAPLVADGVRVYWVVNRAASTLQLADWVGGPPITLTSNGSPTGNLIWPVIDQVFDSPVTVPEALDTLARLSNYVWNVNVDGTLDFIPRTAIAAPFSMTDATGDKGNVLQMSIRKTRGQYFNREFRRVAWPAFTPYIETKVGDGTVRKWTLAHPVAIIESITVDGVSVTVGHYGSDVYGSKAYYFRLGDTAIYQDLGLTVLTAANSLVITYRDLGGNLIFSENTTEQAARAAIETGTSGIYETYVDDSQSADAKGALVKADSDVAVFGFIPGAITTMTFRKGLKPGQLLNIARASLGINGSFLIDQVNCTVRQGAGPLSPVGALQHIIYTVQSIDGTKLFNVIDYFSALGKGGNVTVPSVDGVSAQGSFTGDGGGAGVIAYA